MKRSWLLLGALVVAGCSQTASPTFIDGHYYMAGDPACTQFKSNKTKPVIWCHTAQGKPTEMRPALTDQQLQMYQTNQIVAAQQNAAVSSQIAANNQAINAQTMEMLKQVRRGGY
ncbi:hypothetical protein FG152_22100 [Ochrobactrum sp. XJ1]|nr:hypothetical protein [Ochrobactrum sp. XJ1]